mmetsp:Transcript_29674/g.71436  ORF Transcript_29674/g.71436 Transcript_29674/m.71436 type:complete len:235 (+) Transcript_29674:1710-2414(+)
MTPPDSISWAASSSLKPSLRTSSTTSHGAAASMAALIAASVDAGPKYGERGSFHMGGRSSVSFCSSRKPLPNRPKAQQPTAIPSSPGYGEMKVLENPSSLDRRPFNTEFSPTPPAMHRFSSPVCSLKCLTKSITISSRSIWMRWASAIASRATFVGNRFSWTSFPSSCFFRPSSSSKSYLRFLTRFPSSSNKSASIRDIRGIPAMTFLSCWNFCSSSSEYKDPNMTRRSSSTGH